MSKKLRVKEFESLPRKFVTEVVEEFIETNQIKREDILCINDCETPYKFELGTAYRRITILYYYQ